MRIMIVNRAGTIVYVFFLSLCIDTGITNRTLLIVSIFSSVFVIIYNLFLILNSAKLLEYSADLQRENFMHFLFERDKLYTFASFFATLCNVLGLTLPFLLSNTFPEYRLTMANTGFLLNLFFTLINVIILEKRYAYLLDHETNTATYYFVMKIFIARSFAMLAAVLTLLSIMNWMSN